MNQSGIRLIQVKRGSARASPLEREKLRGMVRPANSSIEVWRFPLRVREPLIEVL